MLQKLQKLQKLTEQISQRHQGGIGFNTAMGTHVTRLSHKLSTVVTSSLPTREVSS